MNIRKINKYIQNLYKEGLLSKIEVDIIYKRMNKKVDALHRKGFM